MIFRQLFEKETSTYTYLIADPVSREAALIDPVASCMERDLSLIDELDLTLRLVMDTHTHADHITSSGPISRARGAEIVVSSASQAEPAHIRLAHQETVDLGALAIRAIHTPGHTPCSVSYHVEDRVFTGDALFVRGCGRTDFQGGDPGQLYDMITTRLFTLPPETFVYPGHDYKGRTVSTIAEEMAHNPRLAGKSRDQFVEIMNNLNLPEPARIKESVPANLRSGLA